LKLILPKQPKALFAKVKSMIQELELEDHVQFLHELSKEELYKEIVNSSCIVIPSYSEGFCFAAAETIALGVPIISSQKGALAEVVSGKYLPIDPFDLKGLLAVLVKAIKGDWKLTDKRPFHLEQTVEAYLALYNDC
jgi:glycosyltransferase involved in cell wall biosynthesis